MRVHLINLSALAGALLLSASANAQGYRTYDDRNVHVQLNNNDSDVTISDPTDPDGPSVHITNRDRDDYAPPPPPRYDEDAVAPPPPRYDEDAVAPPPPRYRNEDRPYEGRDMRATLAREEADLRGVMRRPGVTLVRMGDSLLLDIDSDRLFETDSATLSQRGRDIVDNVADVMRRYPSTYIDVAGFTDRLGSETTNLRLSQDRADAVADMLGSRGIASSRLSAIGRGEDRANGPHSRRVEIRMQPYATVGSR